MKLSEQKELRDRKHVFKDRQEAGRLLADKLVSCSGPDTLVLAIPSGGVPVALAIAKKLQTAVDLIIVRKIQIPHNTEAGFGAVSPDATVILNEPLLHTLKLTRAQIDQQKNKALETIKARNRLFRKSRPYPSFHDKTVIIVDDGLASGYTMRAAIRFVKKETPRKIIVAVPTSSEKTAETVAREIDLLLCLNIRSGFPYAVADAYRNWYDLNDDEILSLLNDPIFS